MSDYLGWSDYLLIALLFVLYTCVGIFYGFKSSFVKCFRRIRNRKIEDDDINPPPLSVDEMFLANRKMTLLPILGSTLASFMSAVALMGNNSEFYLFGIEYYCLVFGYCIGFPIAAEVYTPVFYKLNLASGHEV